MAVNRFLTRLGVASLLAAAAFSMSCAGKKERIEVPARAAEADMDWWRDARFGMFIHWGLYAVPAGKWGDSTTHGEWIRTTAQIPVGEYDKFVEEFNPTAFDAKAWVKLAKQAGMKYIVITTKHHDGFALFDSALTDFDVMSTPWKKDVMREMAKACRDEGIHLCWYHSIMDWHHPDYLPRREWETDRPTKGADFEKYVAYMKGQLGELLTNYGPIGVLWFDGQWEGTWTHERGLDLEKYVRSLQPGIIINNRVDKGGGEFGMTRAGYAGDFGTPEQEIPPSGLAGVDWETCMTMNGHWGYNAADKDFKSTKDLVQKLVDIASKGGNFLLNVGPTASGEFPPESVQRLEEIGEWMKVNPQSIRGTLASPFPAPLPWGRCTMQTNGGTTRLFLHVFDWPADGRLVVPGIYNQPIGAFPLLPTNSPLPALKASREDDSIVIDVRAASARDYDTVIVLDVKGRADVNTPPGISGGTSMFVGTQTVRIESDRPNVEVRYTVDGTEPTAASSVAAEPITITDSATIRAACFRDGARVSEIASAVYSRAEPRPAVRQPAATDLPGVRFSYFEGTFNSVRDFIGTTPARTGQAAAIDIGATGARDDRFGLVFEALLNVPVDGVYTLGVTSDDGSSLSVDGALVVENDGPHSLRERTGEVALAKGLHRLTLSFFEATGGSGLEFFWSGPGMARTEIGAASLVRE